MNNRAGLVQLIDDRVKIMCVSASDDGHACGCGFEHVVTAAIDDAAADENDGGERVSRWQLSNRIEQNHRRRRTMKLIAPLLST